MSAAERLAAALHTSYGFDPAPWSECAAVGRHLPQAEAILAADPHLAQDIEDGAALRELREVVVENDLDMSLLLSDQPGGWHVHLVTTEYDEACEHGTFAEAARKATEALL